MGSIFEEFGITWQGVEYVVPPEKVMGLIEVVEDVITIEELHAQSGLKRSKLSKAFAAIINYAGGKVTQEDVYNSLFLSDHGASLTNIIQSLLILMIPPEHLQTEKPKKPARKKVATRTKRAKG